MSRFNESNSAYWGALFYPIQYCSYHLDWMARQYYEAPWVGSLFKIVYNLMECWVGLYRWYSIHAAPVSFSSLSPTTHPVTSKVWCVDRAEIPRFTTYAGLKASIEKCVTSITLLSLHVVEPLFDVLVWEQRFLETWYPLKIYLAVN